MDHNAPGQDSPSPVVFYPGRSRTSTLKAFRTTSTSCTSDYNDRPIYPDNSTTSPGHRTSHRRARQHKSHPYHRPRQRSPRPTQTSKPDIDNSLTLDLFGPLPTSSSLSYTIPDTSSAPAQVLEEDQVLAEFENHFLQPSILLSPPSSPRSNFFDFDFDFTGSGQDEVLFP
ncbi:hypothetical protein CLU79DRAFT_721799 [Phycomyces nitens]|nr:hypothetical protein CLU79DRAFT_721799 [Phycomyces nitens]